MKIHKPSTLIKITLSGSQAYINEVIIGDTYTMYKCSWFINGELKTATFSEYEFEVITSKITKKSVGFK